MPIIDFGDVKGPEPIPAGTYRGEVKEAKPGVSKNNNPKINVQWKIVGGDYDGRIVFDNLTFVPTAFGVVKAKLSGMGLGDAVVDTDDLEALCEEMLGVQAQLRITIRESTQVNEETGEPYDPQNDVRSIKAVETDLTDLLK